jgi:predicted nucleic acid-binding protein
MTIVDCLFDTNAILKRYHGERGTKIVDYLFEKSRRIRINLLTIQVVEVIKAFYKLRSDNKLPDDQTRNTYVDTFLKDIEAGKITLYDFAKIHLRDMDVYQPLADAKPINIDVWDPQTQTKVKKAKPRPNAIDAIMLIVMREIKFLNELYGIESYLVTSDEPVIEVAQSLGIHIIDPENASIANLPVSLDMREHKRYRLNLKVVCKDPQTSQPLGSTSSMDVSDMGLKIRALQSLTIGRTVNMRLESLSGSRTTAEAVGTVCWSESNRCGVRLIEPLSADFLNPLINN